MDRSRLSSPYINPFASRFTSTLYTPEKEVSLIVKGKKKKDLEREDIREIRAGKTLKVYVRTFYPNGVENRVTRPIVNH